MLKKKYLGFANQQLFERDFKLVTTLLPLASNNLDKVGDAMLFVALIFCPTILFINLTFEFTRMNTVNKFLDYQLEILSIRLDSNVQCCYKMMVNSKCDQMNALCDKSLNHINKVRNVMAVVAVVYTLLAIVIPMQYKGLILLFIVLSSTLVLLVSYRCTRSTIMKIRKINLAMKPRV